MTVIQNGPSAAAHVQLGQIRSQSQRYVPVTVLVDDTKLRELLPGFDGLERPFALVPKTAAGDQWERVELSHDAIHSGRYSAISPNNLDAHNGSVPLALTAENLDAVLRHGVAFGLETNVGTVWLQHPGDNFRTSFNLTG